MKIIYIAHPISSDPKGNIDKILKIIRHINLTEPDVVPFAPYIPDCLAMDDHVSEERARGIQNDTALIRAGFISECRLYGDTVSPGMQAEKQLFEELGVSIVSYVGVEVIPVCKHCNGTSKIIIEQGFYKTSYVCKWCEGTGVYTLIAR